MSFLLNLIVREVTENASRAIIPLFKTNWARSEESQTTKSERDRKILESKKWREGGAMFHCSDAFGSSAIVVASFVRR